MSGGGAPVEAIDLVDLDKREPTFNLEVAIDHVFFVGVAGVLVHNGDAEELPREVHPPKEYRDGTNAESIHRDHKTPKATDLPGNENASNFRDTAKSENLAKSFYDKETKRYVEALRASGMTDAEIAAHIETEYGWASNSAIGEKVPPEKMTEIIEKGQELCP